MARTIVQAGGAGELLHVSAQTWTVTQFLVRTLVDNPDAFLFARGHRLSVAPLCGASIKMFPGRADRARLKQSSETHLRLPTLMTVLVGLCARRKGCSRGSSCQPGAEPQWATTTGALPRPSRGPPQRPTLAHNHLASCRSCRDGTHPSLPLSLFACIRF